MSQTLKPQYVLLTDYTQAEEDTFATTLTGFTYGTSIIYNTTLGKVRVWSGGAFVSTPSNPPANLPMATTTSQGVIPATGTPSGKYLKDDLTWAAIVKADVGLGNVDNVSDANKPVSTAQQTALNLKANLASPAFTTPNIGAATGTSLAVSSSITSSGGGVGYATGAGGTTSQSTSRTTTVIINKLCGTFTMFSAAQANNALVTFTLSNSFIAATDFILIQHNSATNGGSWNISVVPGAGSATINIRNVSTASITEATPLRFVIIKSVTS